MYYQLVLYTKLQTGTLELLQMHKKSKVNLAVNKKKKFIELNYFSGKDLLVILR